MALKEFFVEAGEEVDLGDLLNQSGPFEGLVEVFAVGKGAVAPDNRHRIFSEDLGKFPAGLFGVSLVIH